MSQVHTVLLAVMTLESHGGVADQMTNLAITLPEYGIAPIVLVRNPLATIHPYAAMLRDRNVDLWAIDQTQYFLVRAIAKSVSKVALPLILLDTVLRGKDPGESKASLWGVLRRLGYAGLDAIFWLRLLQAKTMRRVRILHLRKPDGWPVIRWAKHLGYRTIYTEDVVPEPGTVHYYQGLAHVQKSIDHATAVSHASAEELEKYLPHCVPIDVIPNTVIVDPAPPQGNRESDRFVLGCLARLVPQKDIGTLLRAFQLVLAQAPEVRLKLFGDGPDRPMLENLARCLQIEQQVVFAGAFAKSDLPVIMSKIDMIVLSSVYEGFGVVLVEGAAYGKPAVATAAGGVSEVIVNDVTGLLVPIGDPQALAAAILALALDNVRYARMAVAARERYWACYTPDRVVPQFATLYAKIAGPVGTNV